MKDAAESLHPSLLYHAINTLGWRDLRPLQAEAVHPLLSGNDALLVAPTAGGKTEAAVFPLLTSMASDAWRGAPTLLYVCPLRALLNNLEPRLTNYAEWVGRRSAVWHGDVGPSVRRRLTMEWPDILLTTPESLEAMLISTRVDPREAFSSVRAVVVDEVHAFAGDDRGWHLLAVLERITRLATRPLQRVGLSATVGNPGPLLRWLQGSNVDHKPAVVVAPDARGVAAPEIQIDHVGALENAATVLAALHAGEKRLVFCDSRRRVEELTAALRSRGAETFASHASLSANERRRSERAFAESRDCIIVATSTLELGIDVGDLDRVIQIDAPGTVASFLQRLGRSGRRSGTRASCLFLTTDPEALLQTAGLLRLWERGWVEPVEPPPSPRHILAQQLLGLALQEGQLGHSIWQEWLGGLDLAGESTSEIVSHLVNRGFLHESEGLLSMGPEGERLFGRRSFMELTSVFTSAPDFAVVLGRTDLGTVHPLTLTTPVEGPRVLLLGGRAWMVTHVDWPNRRCYVKSTTLPGRSLWSGGSRTRHFQLCQSMREIASGEDLVSEIWLSQRANAALDAERDALRTVADTDEAAVSRDGRGQLGWWTWAGRRANAVLEAGLGDAIPRNRSADDLMVPLVGGMTPDQFKRHLAELRSSPLPLAAVTERAVEGLKFSEALPSRLARATLGERLGDPEGARAALQ